VSFLQVPRGPIVTDELYERHVPHLPNYIVKGHVQENVDNKTHTEGALAFVDLPRGDMTTFDNFVDKVRLTRNRLIFKKKKVCFARFTVLNNVPYSVGAYIVINRQGREIRHQIYDNDLVIVSNISADPDPHFHLYEKLLTAGGKLGESKILYGKKPPCISEASKATPNNVKIILRKLYPRVPNGDCGATGNP
jgi:hypothetical protein